MNTTVDTKKERREVIEKDEKSINALQSNDSIELSPIKLTELLGTLYSTSDFWWYMLTVSYVYNRWGRGEIHCYIDGALQSSVELTWYTNSSHFTRCSIGGSTHGSTRGHSFCGRLTNPMGFTIALLPEQISAIYHLGLDYTGQFRFESEHPRDLSETHRRLIYAGNQLHECLMFAYSPVSCDQHLCLNRAPSCPYVFAHNSHAIMTEGVAAVHETSIVGALHSLGGMQTLYPLFEHLSLSIVNSTDVEPHEPSGDAFHSSEVDPTPPESIAVLLLDLMFQLARVSPAMASQLVRTKGLLLFASGLRTAHSSDHLTLTLVTRLITIARELVLVADLARNDTYPPAGRSIHTSVVFPLLRQLYGYVLGNPDVWIRAPLEVQDQLYQFLATEFLGNLLRHGCVHRTSSVLQCIYMLQYYYAVVKPDESAGYTLRTVDASPLGDSHEVMKLRANLLFHIRQLIVRPRLILDAEMQAIVNYLLTINEDSNLHDILHLLLTLATEHPGIIGPAFVRNDGLFACLKLLNARDEHNRLSGIKLFGFYMQQRRLLKSENLVGHYNIFTLITERLAQMAPSLSMMTYNALFEVLIGHVTLRPQVVPICPIPSGTRIQHANVIQVIAILLERSVQTPESLLVRQTFLHHLIALCIDNEKNRRSVLQLSLWQDCILRITYFYPTNEYGALLLACSLKLFRCLLFHAIREERDGWRVWIDTLALWHLWLERARRADAEKPPSANDASSTPASLRGRSKSIELDLTGPMARRIVGTLTNPSRLTHQRLSDPALVTMDQELRKSTKGEARSLGTSERQPLEDPPATKSDDLRPFQWSYLHQLLLDDLLYAVEEELGLVSVKAVPHHMGSPIGSVQSPKYGFTGESGGHHGPFAGQLIGVSLDATDSTNPTATSQMSSNVLHDSNNATFVVNLVHVLSDCSDMLVGASGGLLPLLAAATASSCDIGTFDFLDGLSMSDAMSFALRVAFLVDMCLGQVDLAVIERQHGLQSGTLVRQFARLYLVTSVRNCLESRLFILQPSHELALQLKCFANTLDGVQFVPILSPKASQRQSHPSLPHKTSPGHNRFAPDPTREVDIIADRRASMHRPFAKPNLIRGILEATSEMELDCAAVRLLCLSELSKTDDSESRLGLCPNPWRCMPLLSAEQLFCVNQVKLQLDTRLVTQLSPQFRRLIYSIRPALYYPVVCDKSFLRAVLQPLVNPELLLQVRDLNRLQGIIFKSEEFGRTSEFLAMAFAYFISVLMVSTYHELLEHSEVELIDAPHTVPPRSVTPPVPSPAPLRSLSSLSSDASSYCSSSVVIHGLDEAIPSTSGSGLPDETEGTRANTIESASDLPIHLSCQDSRVEDADSRREGEPDGRSIGSDYVDIRPVSDVSNDDHRTNSSTNVRLDNGANQKEAAPRVRVDGLTEQMKQHLASTTSFLRDLFDEFDTHFTKHLLGSQGQALLPAGLAVVRDSQSVVDLVMLLCSQEWQTSLQKHAGLAFIELVNEGRLRSHATRTHIVHVAEEACVVSHQAHAADVQLHAEFEKLVRHTMRVRRDETEACAHLIQAARQRDQLSTRGKLSKVYRLLNRLWSNWNVPLHLSTSLTRRVQSSSQLSCKDDVSIGEEFFKLDTWEDDSRRRRRLSPNPYGNKHLDAVLHKPLLSTTTITRDQVNGISSSMNKTLLRPVNGEMDMNGSASGEETDSSAIPCDATAELPPSPVAQVQMDPSTADSNSVNIVTQPELDEDVTAAWSSLLVPLSVEDPTRFAARCIMVSFGTSIHGWLSVSKSEVNFEKDLSHQANKRLDKKTLVYVEPTQTRWSMTEIQAIFTRRYLHRTVALELFVTARTSVLFAFESVATMKRVVEALPAVGVGAKYGLSRSRDTSLANPSALFQQSNMTQRWQSREVSNFDYLMYLNTISGRTYNDLNQYPIFPWILSNYDSAYLDLNEASNYRDLSKPIGALDPQRKAYFDERYASWEDTSNAPFHYGTHYSTAAFVLGYLLRLEPFTTLFLQLQDGKFDHPDRTFYSMARTWKNCRINTSDVKELIPEFFYLPEMFENANGFELGTSEMNLDIGQVILPQWAKSPEDFIRLHRQALESDLVSCQLHHWIDLIFGYKQRGPEAVLATNVFHPLTYEGSVDWSKITDPVLFQAVCAQIQSFGQTPAQLLHTAHPHRNSALHLDPLMFSPLVEELCMIYKFYSHAPVEFITVGMNPVLANTLHSTVITVTANRSFVLSRWDNTAADAAYQTARKHPTVTPIEDESGPSSNSQPTSKMPETSDPDSVSKVKPEGVDSPATTKGGKGLAVKPLTNPTDTLQRAEDPSPKYLLTSDLSSSQSGRPDVHRLGDDFELSLSVCSNQFAVSADNRSLIVAGYTDHSFRLYSLDTGRFVQAIYGHFDVVTCLAFSEPQSGDRCYSVSGSRDCTIQLWLYNTRRQLVLGGAGSLSETAIPVVTLIGHECEVTAVSITSELGLVLSGSKAGTCLLHNTRGTLLRQICRSHQPHSLAMPILPLNSQPIRCVTHHRQGFLLVLSGRSHLSLYGLNGKLLHGVDLIHLAAIPDYDVTTVLTTTCGQYVIVAGTDGVVWVLRAYNLTPVHSMPRCDAAVRSVCLTRDQKFLMVGLSSGSIVVFYMDFSRWHQEFQERYPT